MMLIVLVESFKIWFPYFFIDNYIEYYFWKKNHMINLMIRKCPGSQGTSSKVICLNPVWSGGPILNGLSGKKEKQSSFKKKSIWWIFLTSSEKKRTFMHRESLFWYYILYLW